ncbi:MAG TPA: ribonuclease Y [Anaerolineae bacterium]|nr:ribonuclease Y [Anaerolineae bacterium]HQH38800.1 ribonuclease Y [Anaerolineae bacterium]
MNDWLLPILLLLVGMAVGSFIGYRVRQAHDQKEAGDLEGMRTRLLEEAEKQARDTVLNAKDEALRLRLDLEAEMEHRGEKLRREEERIQARREQLDVRQDRIDKREQMLNKRQSVLDKRTNDLEKLEEEQRQELARVANLSTEEAREVLLERVAEESRQDMARVIREEEMRAKEEAERRAREIVTVVVQRIATEQVAELTTKTLEIPNDELKGRIIGRGGRNIRVFEQKAGVDVIVDDSPEMITISSFNPIMREVAARAMHRLVTDGRIHPARIEKLLEKAREEVDQIMKEQAERAVYEAEVPALHPELMKLLGRLYFRTSYGQNQLAHAVETAKLSSLLAAELGADAEVARLGGLLHDIGKAVDFEVEGTHAMIGAELATRYGVSETIVNAIASHHHEAEQQSLEAIIVETADAISGARPGARRESLEHYIKRIRALEDIARSFPGVEEAYAIQAGREMRIIVRPGDVDDLAALRLSRDVAHKIEDTMEYPGQIKVTVIRETRAVEYAK